MYHSFYLIILLLYSIIYIIKITSTVALRTFVCACYIFKFIAFTASPIYSPIGYFLDISAANNATS